MRKAAQRIVEKLRLHGYEAFFAGGCVRDFLLRHKPKDIDIATSAHPEDVLRLFPKSTAIGARFGVVQVRMYGHSYDVATFRSEGPYLDGRHPSSVSFGKPRQDAMRRDFTINGLFYDPASGRILDYVHGAADIRRRLLRTIGKPQERFCEDKLRMLRAVRLACDLNFRIAPETFESIRRMAPAILEVSWERIRDELFKILASSMPDRGLELLHKTGLLAYILPEIEAMVGVCQPAEFHPEGDVFVHTRKALALLTHPSHVLALGTLLHDVGKPPTYKVRSRIRFDGHVEVGSKIAEAICKRLRLSNEDATQVIALVRYHLHFMNIFEMKLSTLRRFLRLPHFEDHLELHRVDCLSSHKKMQSYFFALEKYQELKQAPPLPLRLITGNDLIAMGYRPGPSFSRVLAAIEDLQLENPQLSREEALDYVRSHPLSDAQNV